MSNNTSSLLTVDGLSAATGFRPNTIRKWARLKMIPGTLRRGGRWRFNDKAKDYFKLSAPQ